MHALNPSTVGEPAKADLRLAGGSDLVGGGGGGVHMSVVG